MALEDICGFQNTSVHLKGFPAFYHEDMSVFLNIRDKSGKSRSSVTHGGMPLDFFIPSIPTSAYSIHRSSASQSYTARRPFPLSHGTTTLGFIFQGGLIAAADTRASAKGLVCCASTQKISPIHSHLVVTCSGSGADCMMWRRILTRETRLYQLRHGRCLSIRGTAKLLSFMLHPFKGTEVCVALILCGWDTEASTTDCTKTSDWSSLTDNSSIVNNKDGPKLIYVCSDGARLQGDLFSVGSGSPYAYGVLDREQRWNLSKEEAFSLAREAVFRATHRDAYSGNNVDLFHITDQGWQKKERVDLKEEYYRDIERKANKVEERRKFE
ncbi:proteasome subunit beta type-11a [Takifugu flavidus]|uniref:proteasome subunit beta type-11a n=1 Tax=Takifugu flavidus TaxID=433684 RepID=UPI0025447045|nr:proteasome subunit beta type-11a [Takifugu flavidus]